MLHPATRLVWRGDDVGYGLVATELIPAGTITWVLDPLDRVLTAEQERLLPSALAATFDKYAYGTPDGSRILCWDLARFMNHSCRPTTLSPGAEFDLAVCDIAAGAEITCDYGLLELTEPLACLCGEPSCRGTVRTDDPLRLGPQWDALVRAAIPASSQVPQPLLSLVAERAALAGWAADPSTTPSCVRPRP